MIAYLFGSLVALERFLQPKWVARLSRNPLGHKL